MSEFINFHSDIEEDVMSFKNRTNNLYEYRQNIKSLINRNGFKATTDLNKFLRLKAIDAESIDIVSTNEAPLSNPMEDADVKAIKKAMENQAAIEFVQLFLDKYMSPLESDIEYRLGKVVAIKAYCYNSNHKVIADDPFTFGQYDEYGRIDSTINLRYSVPIVGITGNGIYSPSSGMPSSSYIVPPTIENYVNFFFPPYRTDAFADDTSLSHIADLYIRTRTWDKYTKKWIYKDEKNVDNITYDTGKLLSMRSNPTLRAPAFKSINDNITMLQYFMEQSIGIVSTYLTEWDISLYIQEGLLSERSGMAPSYLTLTNRITLDNPSRFRNSNAFTYGVLNAAVSKTPIGVPLPNTSVWNPAAFPLSTYWIQYDSINRGDGLDRFYDVALKGFPRYNFEKTYNFRQKLEWGDQLGAAYSGWYNWDNMRYWQTLYTNKGDGFEHVDIVHMNEDAETDIFENYYDKDNTQIDGVIQRIIDALYDSDGNLEMANKLGDPWTDEDEFIDTNGDLITRKYRRHYNVNPPHNIITDSKELYNNNTGDSTRYKPGASNPNGEESGDWVLDDASNTDGADIDVEESDYKILGVRIKGSRILKLFLKKDSITDKVMGIADKQSGSNYSGAASSKGGSSDSVGNYYSGTGGNPNPNVANGMGAAGMSNGSGGANGSGGLNSNGNYGSAQGSSAQGDVLSMIDSDENINGQYSRPSGVSQLSPVLYGGPHGKYYSPKTVQGYFEVENEFFRNVPRMDPNSLTTNPNDNFSGLEHNYSPTYRYKKYAPYRSPSNCIKTLQEGHCDYTYQVVQSLMRHQIWSYDQYGYYNGWYYYPLYQGWEPVYWNSGYVTPDSEINTSGQWHDAYGTNMTEWNNYYSYYSGSYTFFKDYWGKMWTWKRVKNYYSTYGYSSGYSSSKTWSSSYNYSTNFGYWDSYQLKGVYYRRKYYCEYKSWDNYYYPRPLMHSNPNMSNDSYWNITQGCYGATLHAQVSPAPWWHGFFNFFLGRNFIRYTPSASAYHVSVATAYDQNRWRLTFPRSGVKFRNASIYGGIYDIRTNEEDNFLKYVTGNSKAEGNPQEWHDVMMFQSKDHDSFRRIMQGPDLIFKVPVRKQEYDFSYYVTVWYCRKRWYFYWRAFSIRIKIWRWSWTITIWLPWLGWRWEWYPVQEIRIGKAAWIEADMNNVQEVFSGLQTTPWSNLSTIKSSSEKQEIYSDVPPGAQSKSDLPDTPMGFLDTTNSLPNWAIPINTDGTKPYIHGWGYCTTLPGMEFNRIDQSQFEDPREYLNLVRVYNKRSSGAMNAKNVRYIDLDYPFYTLNNNLPLIYITRPAETTSLAVSGVKQYARVPYLDYGVRMTLLRLYTTSTLFKYNEIDYNDFLQPRIVSNDCALRTLSKIAAHQYSWLLSAKTVFLDDIDFNEVLNKIKTTVNKTILSRSLKDSNQYNPQSIYYRYWIDKAYQIFNGSKSTIESAFTHYTNTLSTFMTNSSNLIGKTIYEWTYNDNLRAYDIIKALRDNTILYKNTVTNKKDDTLEEYMFSYLNVLYEYRKFYINQRCNKVNGTLWQLRHLEGAIPEVTTKLDEFDGGNKNGDSKPSTSNEPKHMYQVDFYDVTNSNVDKTKVILDENSTALSKDKTMVIYIKVNYAKAKDVADFLTKCKNGTVSVTDQRYIYIPENGKYAELPFDDIYRYISSEWTENEANKVYNMKAPNDSKRPINSLIDESVFSIQWAEKGKMDRLIIASPEEKVAIRAQFGPQLDYPYVYKKPDGWASRKYILENPPVLPMIKFDIMSGINPGKVISMWSSESYQNAKDVISAKDILCSTGEKSDYWCVAIPISSRPRVVGYLSNLLIKSNRGNVADANGNSITPSTTPSGVFGYMLYPITEEQASSIPGVGVAMSGIQAEIQNNYLNMVK